MIRRLNRLHRLLVLLFIRLLPHLPRSPPLAFNTSIANRANRYLEAANASSAVRLRPPGDDRLVQSYMSEASDLNRVVTNLTYWYDTQRPPPAFGMRRFATDRQFDPERRVWTKPTTLHFRSEYSRTPASSSHATIPTLSSPTAPVVNADTGSTPDDVVMGQSVQDEVERDEAAVPEQDEAPSVGQVELSPDTPSTSPEDVGGWHYSEVWLVS